jgi:hypothetical protein
MSATSAKLNSATVAPSHVAPASLESQRFWTPSRTVAAVILIGIATRLLVASQVGFGNDEGSNYSCSRHLELSYFDHPPMCAWLGRLGTELFGEIGPIPLRLPTILLFAGTTWLMFLTGRRLFGSWPAVYAAALLNLAPVFAMTTGLSLIPDGPLMFFWMAGVWMLSGQMFEPKPNIPTFRWLGVGICLGLAMLSKYNGVLLVVGTVLFVCTRRDQWRWLWHPGPYLALLLAAAVFSPVLIWNAQHGWASFRFQGQRGAEFDGFHFDWMIRSLSGQALWLLPWIWLPLAWELVAGFCMRTSDRRRWFISCLAIPPIAIFTLVALYSRIGMLFHWQCAGYVVLFLPVGDRLHRLMTIGGRRERMARAWWHFACIASPIVMIAIATHTVTGWGLRLLPEKAADQVGPVDPTLEAADYDGLAEFLADRGLLNQQTLIGASRWFLAGKVDYALRSQAPVTCLIEPDPRVFAFFHSQHDWLGKDIVLVSMRRYIDEPIDAYERYFGHIELIASIPVRRGARSDRTLDVYYCTNFHRTLPHPYGIDAERGNGQTERAQKR